ncbi:MAG: tyrosine-type recombinase/integrase [Xanthobacteraceae bacterium]
MARTALTALTVAKIKPPASKAARTERYDAAVPGFGVRITPEGTRSWIFVYTSPTQRKRRRYTIGIVDFDKPDGKVTLNLDQARGEALRLRELVRTGSDPAEVREGAVTAAVAEAEAAKGETFAAIAKDYQARDLARMRRGSEIAAIIDRELVPLWGHLLARDITPIHVEECVLALVRAGKPEAARKLLEIIRQRFDWAMAHPSYRIGSSPADRLKATKLIGKKKPRKRILTDDELRAVWRAAKRAGYPFGPMIKVLMLTALRRNEVAEASRSEFELGRKPWTIS